MNQQIEDQIVLRVLSRLQLLLLFSGNEKTEYIKGFENCVELVEQVLLKNNKITNI